MRPGDAAEGLAVAQMSHAVDEVGLSALLRVATDPAPTIDSPEPAPRPSHRAGGLPEKKFAAT